MWKNEKGQSLVEFALLIPILILILMAIIEFGFMFNTYITVSNASREGARLGSVGATNAEISQRVLEAAPNLDADRISISISPGNRNSGDMINVTIEYDYEIITPIMSSFLSPLIDLEAQTVMRVE
ncbi:pilus assembly protein [Acidaminobacter sp. JC074]|uniref:TadE/TadG family type IV pilus assembly protein n=1 Tax=Acidaminobacter sp. JC074 TaxID=2530199 RepID=UPI001F117FD6|nr:TadE family protein [Acidaminobacter sp. JC074]MCH4890437.1 pilus assembly protein [Acidaminobacter sp. JC074]